MIRSLWNRPRVLYGLSRIVETWGQHDMRMDKTVILGSVALFILSTIDGGLTLRGLSLGAIEELNPIMHWLVIKSPIGFMAVKLALPVILGLIFWRIRNKTRKLVTYGLILVLGVYAVVMGFHVYWIIVG